MKRLGIALSSGLIITLSLFYFMSSLISGTAQLGKKSDDHELNFLMTKNESDLESRKRKLPKKPPPPKKTPPIKKLKVANSPPPKQPQIKMNIPKMNIKSTLGDGPFLGNAGGSSDGDVIPLVRIEPQYPRKAAMNNTEGWVLLKFDISENGTVENVQILQSQPRRIFDSSAKRALLKWKYKPRTRDGKPIKQQGNKVKLDFKLES